MIEVFIATGPTSDNELGPNHVRSHSQSQGILVSFSPSPSVRMYANKQCRLRALSLEDQTVILKISFKNKKEDRFRKINKSPGERMEDED